MGPSSSSIILPCAVPKVGGVDAVQPQATRNTPVFEQRWTYYLLRQGGGTRTPGKDGAPQPEGVARSPGVELAVGDFGDDPGRQDFVLGLTLSGSGDSGVGGGWGARPVTEALRGSPPGGRSRAKLML